MMPYPIHCIYVHQLTYGGLVVRVLLTMHAACSASYVVRLTRHVHLRIIAIILWVESSIVIDMTFAYRS